MYMKEIVGPAQVLRRGSSGFDVMRLQGWLGLQGRGVSVDGDFGEATETAVFACLGVASVDGAGWSQLAAPLIQATSMMHRPEHDGAFGRAVITVAEHHLAEHPREIGGDNRGPWVRHYCRGYEVAWCQGFASSIWDQAAEELDQRPPFALTLDGQWCLYVPRMVDEARRAGLFLDGNTSTEQVPPGSMFFLRGGSHGYSHVGLVVKDNGSTIETIEGNTNDDGHPNGYEVCRRFRRRSSCDYGLAQSVAPPVLVTPPERRVDVEQLAALHPGRSE